LRRLDALVREEAEAELLGCCGSTAWARAMAEQRPFGSLDALYSAADAVWCGLGNDDWMEAFRAHPRIGEKKAEAKQGETAKQWSKQEQSGMDAAAEETRAALAEGNRAYDAKFGHIFIVCATGKSAGEMLAILKDRLEHSPSEEIAIAAEEQRKI